MLTNHFCKKLKDRVDIEQVMMVLGQLKNVKNLNNVVTSTIHDTNHRL